MKPAGRVAARRSALVPGHALLIVVYALLVLAAGCGGDRNGLSPSVTKGFRWQEMEVAQFKNARDISDTKVYRLRQEHEFVFVLSQGRYLDPDNPRTSYFGHVGSDNAVELTDLRDITERNTRNRELPEVFVLDIADAHVHVTAYDPDHLWVSWTCGLDTHVCAIRSEDAGRSFNDDTFSVVPATGFLHTVHEPSVTCNRETDCLLAWGETLIFTAFDLHVRHFSSSGWCGPEVSQRIGQRLGIPVEMTSAAGKGAFLVSAVDFATDDFQMLRSEPSFLYSETVRFADESCRAEVGNVALLETGLHFESPAGDFFHYTGGSGNISPRVSVPSLPTWQIYSAGRELRLIRRDGEGRIDTSDTIAVSDPRISIQAGNVDFDEERFFLFYHRFYGVNHPEHANTYSICYRTTEDALGREWSGEICPVEHLPGLTAEGNEFGNMIQPVGSAWHGNISVIFQKDCGLDACSLALKRFENDSLSY